MPSQDHQQIRRRIRTYTVEPHQFFAEFERCQTRCFEGLQVKLARDIGQYYGHKVDREAAKTMLAGLGLGTGARIAVSNLVKFIPGWGSAIGATTSFASTFALGKIVERYFRDHEGKGDIGDLRADFKSAQKEGKKAYEESKAAVAEKEEANKAKLLELSTLLKDGKITQAEYEAQAAALV